MRKHEKNLSFSFIDLEKAYNRVSKEPLWQVLRMHDVGGKLLGGIKSMYVDSLAYIRVKGGESEWFRIDSGVRQGCIMSPWLFNVYIDAVTKELEDGDRKEGREWRLPGLLYADDLVLCGESEEELRAMVGQFIVYRRRGLKANAGKSEVMVINGEEGLECEVHIDDVGET